MGSIADIVQYLRIYRSYIGRRLYLVFALTILAALTEGLGITLLLPLLKTTATAGGGESVGIVQQGLDRLLQSLGIAESTLGILVFIAIVFVLKGAIKFSEGAYQSYLQALLYRRLKSQLFDAYSGMQYQYYISRNTGHFINVINAQIGKFWQSFKNFVGFTSQVITTISYFAIAFLIAWRFALMAVGIGIVLLFLFKWLNAYVRELSRKTSKEMSELNTFLVQALQAFKYVVATDQIRHLRSGVVDSIHRLTSYQFRTGMATAFTTALREPLSVLFIIGVIAVQVSVFNSPVAPIFVAILLFHRGMQAVISVQSGWQSVMSQVGGLEMVTAEFDRAKGAQELSGNTEIGPLTDGIRFEDVSFRYDDEEDEDVLDDINVNIPANTTVALVGESGAGKSTLVDMITLMLQPNTGHVIIDGVPGQEIKLDSWRSQIGYVSQETVVFDDTIANNISLWQGGYADDADLRERVQDAARQAYAHEFIENLPDGYQTVVGDRGVRLSGGQRQRLFVARELFKQPNLLLLDEATSALDTESERYIQQSIDDLQGEVTVVIIAHRLSTIKNVDYVYVLDHGRVVEEGKYEDLRTHETSRFRQMVEMQSL